MRIEMFETQILKINETTPLEWRQRVLAKLQEQWPHRSFRLNDNWEIILVDKERCTIENEIRYCCFAIGFLEGLISAKRNGI